MSKRRGQPNGRIFAPARPRYAAALAALTHCDEAGWTRRLTGGELSLYLGERGVKLTGSYDYEDVEAWTVGSAAEAWEVLATRGVIDAATPGAPREFERVARVGSQTATVVGMPCPETIGDAVTFAGVWPTLVHVEALAREAVHRLTPLMVSGGDGALRWRLLDDKECSLTTMQTPAGRVLPITPPFGWEGVPAPALHVAARQLSGAGSPPLRFGVGPPWTRLAKWADQWERERTGSANPFAPFVAIWQAGCAVDRITTAHVTLVCPRATGIVCSPLRWWLDEKRARLEYAAARSDARGLDHD